MAQKPTPNNLIALPSLSCALSSLPQAKSLDGVSLHHPSMSSQRAAESEAKLRQALSKTSSSQSQHHTAANAGLKLSHSPDSDSHLMMKPLRNKIQV